MKRDAYDPFYGWLLMAGIILFGFYLLWDLQLLQHLLVKDVTYLSSFILVLFVAVTLYLGLAAWQLAKQRKLTWQLLQSEKNTQLAASWAQEHRQLLQCSRQQTGIENESLLARLVEQVHRGHTSGWFLSDLLMRLGLIGTVIGFVLMLGSVYELKEADVTALQQLLATMGSGMQVALYTTLTGLGTALLVGIQCQWLDRCADRLVSQIIKLGVETQHGQPV